MPAIGPSAGDPATSVLPHLIGATPADDRREGVTSTLSWAAWRIIHIAAHGEPPLDGTADPRGVVLSDDSFLGPREIAALRVIPELVFVNCCHLAASSAEVLGATNYDRARFASGVAHALIKGGVRCVIAAGWAVEDHAASEFARTFYAALVGGKRFIDAVAAARTKARACGGNTWAAYQCYGDPDWRFKRSIGDAQRPAPAPGQEFGSIASAPALLAALELIAVQSEFQGADPTRQADRLRFLDSAHARFWGSRGDVAAAFGTACPGPGSSMSDRVVRPGAQAQDGTAPLAAVEQLANMKIRAAWQRSEDAAAAPAAIDAARGEMQAG